MRVGVFGGTFNPIHFGHLRVAEEVREELGLERVVFVPSSIPPHKELHLGVPAEKRLEIARLAVEGNPCFEISSFEVEEGGSSHSIRTIEHFREVYGITPYFILGQDAFNEISTWFQFPRFFDLAHFVVMSRPGTQRPDLRHVLGDESARFAKTGTGYRNDAGNFILFVGVTPLDISSTLIRTLCSKGRSVRYLVPEKVEEYMRHERIYE